MLNALRKVFPNRWLFLIIEFLTCFCCLIVSHTPRLMLVTVCAAEMLVVCLPVSQMRKLRPGEGNESAQIHAACRYCRSVCGPSVPLSWTGEVSAELLWREVDSGFEGRASSLAGALPAAATSGVTAEAGSFPPSLPQEALPT